MCRWNQDRRDLLQLASSSVRTRGITQEFVSGWGISTRAVVQLLPVPEMTDAGQWVRMARPWGAEMVECAAVARDNRVCGMTVEICTCRELHSYYSMYYAVYCCPTDHKAMHNSHPSLFNLDI